ncbi:MAG TPA: QueT transporter family protein [Thermoleophilia bacterium]|nr:QueT transporter family protein [Thermoleophilia bacterium]
MTTRVLVRAAVYAVAYAALTLAPGLQVLAYGPVQFRVAEALTVFACFDPAAIVGLTLGTALGNVASPMALVDVPIGALLTLVATALMYRIGPRVAALAAPVVVNGLGVPVMLAFVLDVPYWYGVVFVALGEAVVMGTLGLGLLVLVRERGGLLGLPAAGRTPRDAARRGKSRDEQASDEQTTDAQSADARTPGRQPGDDDTRDLRRSQ